MKMVITILVQNRTTKQMRKIKKSYAEINMRNLEDSMAEICDNEAVIEIHMNADSMF